MVGDYDDVNVLARVRDVLTESLAFIRGLLSDDLLHHGSLLAGATVLTGACNYAFQIFMGRALGPSQYGVFGALFALFYLVSVLGSGIKFSASRFTTELDERGSGLISFHRGLFVRSLAFGCAISVALVLASPLISQFLMLSSVWPVVAVGVTIPFVFPFMANMGSLQGLQLFGLLGTYSVVDAGVKLLAGVGLVLLGYGIYGAFGAMVIAAATALTLTTLHLRKRLPEPSVSRGSRRIDFENVYTYVPPAILAGFCLTVPANVDVILVRHFFSGDQAGLYTAASVLGKVLIFLPMGITTVLFPKTTSDYSSGESEEVRGLLYRALLYTAITAGTGALAFWFLPTLILDLFFGASYVAAAPLVRWYGVAILGFVLVVVILNFELARDRTQFVYAFTAMTVVEIGLMWLTHGSMVRVVQVILLVNAGMFVYGMYRVSR